MKIIVLRLYVYIRPVLTLRWGRIFLSRVRAEPGATIWWSNIPQCKIWMRTAAGLLEGIGVLNGERGRSPQNLNPQRFGLVGVTIVCACLVLVLSICGAVSVTACECLNCMCVRGECWCACERGTHLTG